MSEELLADVRRSAPGFRLSQRDVLVITVCILATVWLWDRVGELSLLMLGVLGHFFLFCNVFRVRTRYELVWAATFLLNAIAWQLAGDLSWQRVLGSQLVITFTVIAAELGSPRYHGIGCRWIRGEASRPANGVTETRDVHRFE